MPVGGVFSGRSLRCEQRLGAERKELEEAGMGDVVKVETMKIESDVGEKIYKEYTLGC